MTPNFDKTEIRSYLYWEHLGKLVVCYWALLAGYWVSFLVPVFPRWLHWGLVPFMAVLFAAILWVAVPAPKWRHR